MTALSVFSLKGGVLSLTLDKSELMTEKRRKFIINTVYFAIILVLFFLFLRYAFQPLLPILISGFFGIVLQKPINRITEKTGWKKGLVAPVIVLLVILALGVVFYFVGTRLIDEIQNFITFIRLRIEDYSWIEKQVYSLVDTLPGMIKDSVTPKVNEFLETLKPAMERDASTGVYKIGFSIIDFSSVYGKLSTCVLNTAKQIPSLLVAVIVIIVLSCFMAADYDVLSSGIKKLIPGGENNIISAVKRVLMTSVWKLIKAYFFICCITFAEMLVGLSVFRLIGIFSTDYIFAIALFAAVFDILPVVGIGAILWPWAIYSFVTGNTALGIGLIVLYALITVVRQIIEPKFIAGQMSLPPALTLTVMYVGLKTTGVIGMFAFTIALYTLKVLDSEGVIHLFGSDEKEKNEASEAFSEEKVTKPE